MSPADALSDLGDRAQAKVDAELAKAKHPSSDGLRALADWLDEHGQSIGVFYAALEFTEPSPTALADFVRRTGAKVKATGYSWLNVSGEIGGIQIQMTPSMEKVAPIRKVMREVEEPDLSGFAS
jgi:hypothetical protein